VGEYRDDDEVVAGSSSSVSMIRTAARSPVVVTMPASRRNCSSRVDLDRAMTVTSLPARAS